LSASRLIELLLHLLCVFFAIEVVLQEVLARALNVAQVAPKMKMQKRALRSLEVEFAKLW
jgi:hypothetical protein